jgi:hypothetical protein
MMNDEKDGSGMMSETETQVIGVMIDGKTLYFNGTSWATYTVEGQLCAAIFDDENTVAEFTGYTAIWEESATTTPDGN